jgi:hypothetical protein
MKLKVNCYKCKNLIYSKSEILCSKGEDIDPDIFSSCCLLFRPFLETPKKPQTLYKCSRKGGEILTFKPLRPIDSTTWLYATEGFKEICVHPFPLKSVSKPFYLSRAKAEVKSYYGK